MNELNVFICKECNCWMHYHEVQTTTDKQQPEGAKASGDAQGILHDFYLCSRCGSTALTSELTQPIAA